MIGFIAGAAAASLYWWNSEPRSYGECFAAETKDWSLDDIEISRKFCSRKFLEVDEAQ